MRTLDRYIIRTFLHSALMWFVVMMALRVVVDLFVNMDEFAKQDRPFMEMVADIGKYYGYQSLVYFTELGGVIVVAAAAFTIAMMNHTNELTAMMASGVSLKRVVTPIILSSVILSSLIVLDQEMIIPRVRDKLVRSRDEISSLQEIEVRLTADSNRSVWYSRRFTPAEKSLTGALTGQAGAHMDQPIVWLRDEKFRALGSITAERAQPGKLDGVKGWFFSGDPTVKVAEDKAGLKTHMEKLPILARISSGTAAKAERYTPNEERIFTPMGPQQIIARAIAQTRPASQPAPTAKVQPVVIRDVDVSDVGRNMIIRAQKLEPLEGPDGQVFGRLIEPRFIFQASDGQIMGIISGPEALWRLGDRGETRWDLTDGRLFYPSDLAADDLVLRQSSHWLDYMSSRDLSAMLRMKQVPDPQAVLLTKYIRFCDPINNLLMLLLGLPFILSRERNIKASTGLCLLMVGGFYAFIYICRYMGLPPIWSAWLPILLFGPIAVVMLDSVKS